MSDHDLSSRETTACRRGSSSGRPPSSARPLRRPCPAFRRLASGRTTRDTNTRPCQPSSKWPTTTWSGRPWSFSSRRHARGGREHDRRIKIPNACLGVNVRYVAPFAMLRAEKARFVSRRQESGSSTEPRVRAAGVAFMLISPVWLGRSRRRAATSGTSSSGTGRLANGLSHHSSSAWSMVQGVRPLAKSTAASRRLRGCAPGPRQKPSPWRTQ